MSTRIILISLALALVAAPAALAQEAVSREEAAAAETERRSFFRPSVPIHGTAGSCRDCSTLGDRELFDYPLYDDCDVALLESIFDRDFAYSINAQAAALFNFLPEVDPAHDPTAVGASDKFVLPLSGTPFLAQFTEVGTLEGLDITYAGSAPTFRGEFTGRASAGSMPNREFKQGFLCTLNPSASKHISRADCTADLESLQELGVIANITYVTNNPTVTEIATIPAPLSKFTLTFKRDIHCSANDIIFVGTNVEAGRAFDVDDSPNALAQQMMLGNGVPFFGSTSNFTVVQQVTLKGTRIFKSH